jgi:hypothetical protein
MLTDRAPFEYVYLSSRLLTDLVQHDEATRSRRAWTFDVNLRFLGLHRQRRVPDLANLRDLAARSLEIVEDNTGNIDVPGYFVHDQMELRQGVFSPHMGWPDGHIACYYGVSSTDGATFVALFGSATNVVGRRRANADNQGSFYPSDAAGLYALLDVIRERDDPEIDLDYRLDDHAMSDESRAERAVMFAKRGASGAARPLEFLARVYLDVQNYSFGEDVYRRVVVGAPLWIATPRPTPTSSPRTASTHAPRRSGGSSQSY